MDISLFSIVLCVHYFQACEKQPENRVKKIKSTWRDFHKICIRYLAINSKVMLLFACQIKVFITK